MLYCMPGTGVTVILAPVLHVAGNWVAVGALGIAGAGATTIWKAGDTHPAAFLTVTL